MAVSSSIVVGGVTSVNATSDIICSGGAITFQSGTLSGPNSENYGDRFLIELVSTGLPITVSGYNPTNSTFAGSSVFPIGSVTNTGTNPVDFVYKVTAYSFGPDGNDDHGNTGVSDGNQDDCLGVDIQVTLTVNPATVIITQPIDATYCKDATSNDLTVVASGTPTISFEWFKNLTNSNSGGTSVGTGNSYTPPTNIAGNNWYYAVVTSSVCNIAVSNAVEIIVNTLPSISGYTTPVTYLEQNPITTNSPTFTGTNPISISMNALPPGLSLSSVTGEISGVPTAPTVASNYIVTASNVCGSVNTNLNISISALPFAGGNCRLLNENFSNNTQLANANVDGAWYPDRYRPAQFISDAGNLKISINAVDGAQLRPSPFASAFYNTQGRKFNQCGKCVTIAKADLYIPSDWATKFRRSDLWATVYNSANAISFYPIIEFRNVTSNNPNLAYWNGTAWTELGPPSNGYNTFYTLEIRLVGTNIEYLINNVVVGVAAASDPAYMGDVMLQAYNFNDNSLGVSYDSSSDNSYESIWDNVITTGNGGNVVTNFNTGLTYCSIQAAINDANTINGHTLVISSGTYNENILLNKEVTLQGQGPANTIIKAPTSCTGNGVAISVSNAKLKDLKVTDFSFGVTVSGSNNELNNVELVANCNTGLDLGNGTNNLAVLNSKLNNNTLTGFRKGTAAVVNGFTMNNSEVTGNVQGCFISKNNGVGGTFDNVSITNSNFSNNLQKGMYFEALSNATIDNITMNNSGTDPSYGFNNGIDINLKYGSYSNIVIQNSTFTGCGANGIAGDVQNAAVIAIKGRDDAPSYNGNPAFLDDVEVKNNFISGPVNGLRLGEFGKINNSPTNVKINQNDLSHAFSNVSIVNRVNSNVDAECNWFGLTDFSSINSEIAVASGAVDFTSWLLNGTDEQAMIVGFQNTSCDGTPVAIVSSTSTPNQFCQNNGTITLTFSGGTGPYTVSWTGTTTGGPISISSGVAFGTFMNGTYTFTVTDANGSTASSSVSVSNAPIKNSSNNTYYATMQAAIDAASPGHIIELCGNHSEGLITVNKPLEIDGNGQTLTSSSSSWGIGLEAMNINLHDLVLTNTGTQGIQQGCDADNLIMTNVTVTNSGGTGISIYGSDNAVLTSITSTNNDGNGLNITNSNNTVINGITTSGNAFNTGFSAGIGIFTSNAFCLPAEVIGLTLSGTVNIAEPTKVYSQKADAGHVISGLVGPDLTWAVGIGATDRNYWPTKTASYGVVDALFEAPYNFPNTSIYVVNVPTEKFYVDDNPNGDNNPPMLIQTAINLQAPNGTIIVESGNYAENVTVNKPLILQGEQAGIACDGSPSSESIISGTGGSVVTVAADGVTLDGFSITGPTSQFGIAANAKSNLILKNNRIYNVGNIFSGGPVYGIYFDAGTTNSNNLSIVDNCVDNIASTSLTGFSAGGIGILGSTSTGILNGLSVQRNLLSNINVNNSTWPTGKIAYGLIMNVGGTGSFLSNTGKIVNTTIKDNEISNLSGHIATAIGLEGNTETVALANNLISNLSGTKSANRAGGGFDISGLKVENNKFVGTITVLNNGFNTNTFSNNSTPNLGYAVSNYVPAANGGNLTLACNWYGASSYNVIEDNATFTGKIFNKENCTTTFVPFITSGGDNTGLIGFQPTGACNGTPVIIADITPDPIICGETTGGFSINYTGGTPNYTISWSGPAVGSTTSPSLFANVSGLIPGLYTVTVTEVNGSTATTTVSIDILPVTNTTDGLHFATIQAAIDASTTETGDVIEVCQGTYMESVVVNKSIHLKGKTGEVNNTFIMAPSTLPNTSTQESYIIKVSGAAVSAEISELTIKGPGPGGCGTIGYGILVRDAANANIHNNKIIDVRDQPFSGCQNGIAIQVGRQAWSTTGTATITNNIISGYQKNGITVDNTGSNAIITGNIITGAGTTPTIAQNGLQVSRGATATVTGNTITGNSFHLTGNPSDWGSTGILLFQNGQVTLAGGNNLNGNDQNYYAFEPVGTIALGAETFGSSTAPLGFGNQIVNVSSQDLDLRTSTFGGISPSVMTPTQLFELEDYILHKIDSLSYGFVYVKTNNTYVTPLSFVSSNAQIQRGIDAASAGFTVNVRAGAYAKQIAPNKSVFGVGSYQFGLSVDKNNLTVKGYGIGDAEVGTAMDAAVVFNTGATNNFGSSGIFVQGNGVKLSGLKIGDNLDAGNALSNNKTIEVVGDNFTLNKCWIQPDADAGAIYLGRWDASHPVNSYNISNNKLENTLVCINNGVGLSGSETSRLITNNTFEGIATPYLIGFRGWNGAGPVQGWIVDPVGGAVITGNAFNNTGVESYIIARGNVGGYNDAQLNWKNFWDLNTYGKKVITLSDEPNFDPRTFNSSGYTASRRITPFIQENINIGASGDVVLVGQGIYPESLTFPVNNLTLKGEGTNKSLYVIDGTTVTGPANGITINSNITGSSISNLTIQNFSGANGNSNAGIYAVGQNNSTIIDNVALINNTNGSGFYANGPVNGITINGSMVIGHTVGARGIVIWNGFKENITITNNMVTNNNCCGIELQDGTASAVNISGNIIDIGVGDNAIAALGLNSLTDTNTISNNIITGGGRFGIEIKNPNGGVTVAGNNVTLSTQNGDMRDRAGIAIMRRDFTPGNPAGYADTPNGVTITGNTITGYQQTSGEEGFGIVIEGTNHVVSGNTLNGNEVGIQIQGGGHANPNYVANNSGSGDQAVGQSPNYFGRGNAPTICESDLGMNNFSGNGIDVRLVTGAELSTDISYIQNRIEGGIHNITLNTYHCFIQDAIDQAATGNIIEILPTSYVEPGQIVVNKNLTLKGQGGFILVNTGIQFNLQDLTIDGSGKLIWQALRHKGSGTVNNVAFHEIKYQESGPAYNGTALVAFGSGNVDVTNCMFTQIGRIGAQFFGSNITNSTFANNMYTGKGVGNWLDYGLEISAGAIVHVEGNTITNNLGVATFDGSTSSGILATTFFGAGTTATIVENNITGNSTGIYVGFDGSDASIVTAHNNNITGNNFGVRSTAPIVNAANNWWGSASGPSGQGPGTGDAVSEDVIYCPWLNASYPGGVAVSNIHNVTLNTYHCTIQDAIDHANPLNIIEVGSGNYTEAITINKNITLNGANEGTAGMMTRSTESVLLNCTINVTAPGPVVIDGFKILRNDNYAGNVVLLGSNSDATIINNIFERNGSSTGTIVRAIAISPSVAPKTISNNLFTGDLSGGLFSGHKTWNNAIYADGNSTTTTITNNKITNSRSGLNLDDHNNNNMVSGNTFENNGTHISFGGTIPTTGSFTLGANNFINNAATTMINNSNVAETFRLDISSSSLNGSPFSSLTIPQLFEVEARMAHKEVTASKKGKVIYKAGNQYVNNFTSPVTKIDQIQNSVKYFDAGDTINLEDGTYNQRVVLDKNGIILQGVTNIKGDFILDGTGLIGTGNGITINNNITGSSISNLTIQNFAGTGGNANAGIKGLLSNSQTSINNVAVNNNSNASGIFFGGGAGIQNVSVTNSMVSNHLTGARGIVIWDGFKENITITNNMVTNNNCCGIELQDGTASAVNISGNTIDIGVGDNAIGLTSLNGLTGPNLIDGNNIIGAGRFGIEIKNPAGAVTVSNNTIALSSPPNDTRDRAGIAVFRRGFLPGQGYVEIPNGVTISNNTVSNVKQSSASDGFGIVVEGTNHIISNNNLNNNDIGIQQQAGHTPYTAGAAVDGDQSNLSDLYFGRGNSPELCNITLNGNLFSGNLVNERIVVGGGLGTIVPTVAPNANINAPFAVWQNSIGNVVSVPNAGSGAEYIWNIVNGTITSGITTNSITYSALSSGQLTISVVVTSSNECTSSGQVVIEVIDPCEIIDFDETLVLGPAEEVGKWFVDRYAPGVFAANSVAPDGKINTLHHGILAADGQATGFYNTQGRGYLLGPGSVQTEIDLYIPADWASAGKRMAGFWGVALDNANAISGYPIIEFTSDGGNPRFRGFEGDGSWIDMGLPSGFSYNQWVKLTSIYCQAANLITE
ncbi:MAG: right-handed parallel beta-helix repeat-containing protein [Saprospiraceae bacterium]|nr:right-handed parallel beta-helix repeat-containing protein [Saprospiraceae bacterium]